MTNSMTSGMTAHDDAVPAPAPSPDAAYPAEVVEIPRDWSMIVIMMAIVAALGFGGTAMMYRRAEASKFEAEAAMAQAREAREQAEQARKDANAQRRLVDDLRGQVRAAVVSEADARREAEAFEALARANDTGHDIAPEFRPSAPLATPAPAARTGPASSTGQLRPAALQSDLLRPVDPKLPVPSADLRAVLDSAARELDPASTGNRASDGAVQSTLGRTYLSVGDYARAVDHLRRAVDLRTATLGANHPEVVKDRQGLEQARRQLPRVTSTQ